TNALLQTHSILLTGLEALLGHWLSRHREAASDAQRALVRLPMCRSIVDIWQVQQEWMVGVSRRLVADAFGPPGSAAMWTNALSPGSPSSGRIDETIALAAVAEREVQTPVPASNVAGTG